MKRCLTKAGVVKDSGLFYALRTRPICPQLVEPSSDRFFCKQVRPATGDSLTNAGLGLVKARRNYKSSCGIAAGLDRDWDKW